MPITLNPRQEAWLQAQVTAGEFNTVEEAARQLLDERIAERELEEDDLAWARHDVDHGVAALDRGTQKAMTRVVVTSLASEDIKKILVVIAREAGYSAAQRYNARGPCWAPTFEWV